MLRKFQSHKVVEAAKITGFSGSSEDPNTTINLYGGGAVVVDTAWMKKHEPEAGGYFVQYPDGYQSYSPDGAFESGYTLVDVDRGISKVHGIAMLCHELNRAYCRILGDHSQVPWAAAPEWQQKSAIEGVKHALAGTRTPQQSHESWLRSKEADGWKYGPVKDAEKKEHPCFVPYDELPDDQKLKDALFLGVVNAFKTPTDRLRLSDAQVEQLRNGDWNITPRRTLQKFLEQHNDSKGLKLVVHRGSTRIRIATLAQDDAIEGVVSGNAFDPV